MNFKPILSFDARDFVSLSTTAGNQFWRFWITPFSQRRFCCPQRCHHKYSQIFKRKFWLKNVIFLFDCLNKVFKDLTLPLGFRKAGMVWCGGARETHWATCNNEVTPRKTKEFLKSPCFFISMVVFKVKSDWMTVKAFWKAHSY